LLGQHGVAIEPGSPPAFVRGITKILQLTPERRAQLASGARKHVLQNYVYVRSLQKFLQLYGALVGRESLAEDIVVPAVDAAVPIPVPATESTPAPKPTLAIDAPSDPDSLETKVAPTQAEALPKWRIEQERARQEQEVRAAATAATDGDVLQIFEMEIAKPSAASIVSQEERARGVAEEVEELLPVEAITVPVAPAPAPTEARRRAPSAARPGQQSLFELELEPASAPEKQAANR
jgi:hypothetical protein